MRYNNGDIDDLFRRASDRYPLRTDSADWDRLAGALDGPMPPSGKEDERRRRRGVFWWFLLIPLAGAGYLTWQLAAHRGSVEKNAVRVSTVSRTGTEGKGQSGHDQGVAGSDLAGTTAKPAESSGNKMERKSAHPSPVAGTGAGNLNAEKGLRTAGNARNVGDAVKGSMGPGINKPGINKKAAAGFSKIKKGVAAGAGSENQERVGKNDGHNPQTGEPARASGVSQEQDHQLLWTALDLRRAPIGDGQQVNVNFPAPVAPAKSPTPPEKKPAGHSRGYVGITGAPDFSTVKFQSMRGVGTTFGLLLGYGINDRWAVETGIYIDRKKYYTEGEYFNTSKVRLPAYYYKLLNVDGACYMWEIPVNVRYNLSTGPRMQWFATAGVSTYLMTRENYSYQYENWANGPAEDSNWNIKRPSHYWLAILNLSAGFEQKLGKIGNLRLEPYIRIPMSGIGTGNLPIMSAGLNIGLTRRLW